MLRQVIAVRTLFALVSVAFSQSNNTISTAHVSSFTLTVSAMMTSAINSTWSQFSTNNYPTTSSVQHLTVSNSSTAHSSTVATSVNPSTVMTTAGDTIVSPSPSGNATDNITALAASSTAAVSSTAYGSTTTAVPSTTFGSTTAAEPSTTYGSTTAAEPSTTYGSTATDTPSSKTLVAVLAVVIPILVLVIIAGVLFHFRKRLKNLYKENDAESSSEVSLALPQYTSLVVDADEFLNYINDMQKECDFKYAEQFESLQLVGREQSTDQALLKCNIEKNRYINIHPYDITRVKLLSIESEEGSDYINASWIPGYYSKREYIAAQGSLPATEDDMWRMVWEYKCKGIVMLTKCMEGGRKKCDQYWPEDMEPVVYGDIQVVLVSEASEENKWTIKKLELSVGQQKRTIKWFHFIEWPDNGVPESPEVLLEFMQVVKKELETAKAGPLVVHCSAGVGRTGTYIAIETLLLQLENERQLDVFGTVYRLRLNRVFMVQTEVQYKFIHETMGHVIRKQNENETQSEEAKLLNHDMQPTIDPEHVQITEIQVSTYDAPDIEGKDNLGFQFSSQT